MKLEDNPAFKKYEGKTVKINKVAYIIEIYEQNSDYTYGEIEVLLRTKYYQVGDTRIYASREPNYPNNDHLIQVWKCANNILEELQDADIPDVEVKEVKA